MKRFKTKLFAATLFALVAAAGQAPAQTTVPGQPIVPLGYCQLSASQLGSAVGLSSCVRASFTASSRSLSDWRRL